MPAPAGATDTFAWPTTARRSSSRHPTSHLVLPPGPAASGRARKAVGDLLSLVGRGDLADVALLLTSELVANALQHGEPPIELQVAARDDGVVTVAVVDAAPLARHAPTPRRAGSLDTGGRGLALVALLADRWGVTGQGAGKAVWFEVGAPG